MAPDGPLTIDGSTVQSAGSMCESDPVSEFDQLRAEVAELRNVVDQLRALADEVPKMRDEAAATRTLAALADRDVAEVRAMLRAQIFTLSALRETQVEQGATLRQIAETVGVLVAQVDGFTAQVDGLGTHIDGLGTQVDGLGTRVDGLGTRVDGLGTQVDGLAARFEALVDGQAQRAQEASAARSEQDALLREILRRLPPSAR